ncbi:MAG TPA: TRAM domain-containing protein [Terrimesophilobacter sp.]|uniref:class I SAM-dependent RNA methyltransferase n=1 Tax=Terrimesophilobacter sp. TaxID=2906435 RepID=UPI002F95D34B
MGDAMGRMVELEISNVAHGGVMVARDDGRVVFVADAIPGELVRAVVTDDAKARFWRADTVEVLRPSEHRRPHVWSAAAIERAPADRAGGAEFGHIELAHQRELKRQVLDDALRRMAGIESSITVEELPGPADGTGWRTRVRLHAAEDGTLGPYAARSRNVIPVTDLPLATPEVVAAAPLGKRAPGGVGIVAPSEGDPWVLTAGSPRARITERVGEREFHLDVAGFWQVHRHAAETLTAAVQAAVDPGLFDPRAENLDLYGGVGLLAAALGDRFGEALRITTVESDAAATDFAVENLAEWAGASAVTARVDRYLAQLVAASGSDRTRLHGGTVVLDPPRSGAGKTVVAQLAELGPSQVVYVACDPVALARDLALFSERGYRLTGLRAFDLFPNTHHVEAVASLVRA